MRHTTCLAQQNEVRLTSIAYAWLSLCANSVQRSKPNDDNSSLGSGQVLVMTSMTLPRERERHDKQHALTYQKQI